MPCIGVCVCVCFPVCFPKAWSFTHPASVMKMVCKKKKKKRKSVVALVMFASISPSLCLSVSVHVTSTISGLTHEV